MVFISTLIPIENISTLEDITSKEWFLLQIGIKSKTLADDKLSSLVFKLYIYSYWYEEKPHIYLMTDNYYYKSKIYNLLPNSFQRIIQTRIPKYFSYNEPGCVEQYPMLSDKKRTIKEDDIKIVFESLLENNFKNNPIIHLTLGGQQNEQSI